MIPLKSSLLQIKNKLVDSSQKTFKHLLLTLTTDLNISEQPISNPTVPKPLEITESKSILDQKVLQIDVIESTELIKSQENIAPLTHQSNEIQLSPNKSNLSPRTKENRNHSNLKHIQNQKRAIYEELKQLDAEIAEIKGEGATDVLLKRKERQQQSEEAKKKARELVRQLKVQRKQIQEKKKRQAEKALLLLKQEEEQSRKRRQEEVIRAKEERRKAIEQRMEGERKKREERKLIQKESNKLIKQLKKEEQMLKMKEQLPLQTGEIEMKKKVVEKKQDVNFREIEEHERRYIQMKQQQRSIKKQRSQSVSHHQIHKYPKNVWIQNIQEQEVKKREYEKLRQAHKRDQYQKRKKYGELVKNIFIPKQKKQTIQEPSSQKPGTPEGVVLPRIAESDKRITDSKPMKKFIEQNRPFATAHNPKPPRQPMLQPKEPQNLQLQRQRQIKQSQMRRQTKQRLKKLQNKSLQALPQYKPKYQNYLGQVRGQLGNEVSSWKKVIENDNLSKEEKYSEMVRRAAALETRAKVKEQLRKEGDEDALNLYIGSIQAKLAILQKF